MKILEQIETEAKVQTHEKPMYPLLSPRNYLIYPFAHTLDHSITPAFICQALSCLLDIHLGANLDIVPDLQRLTLLTRKIIIHSGSHKGMQNGNSDEDPLRRAHCKDTT